MSYGDKGTIHRENQLAHSGCARLSNLPFGNFFRRLGVRRERSVALEMRLEDVLWTLGSIAGLHHRPFDAELVLRQLPTPPLTTDSLIAAARSSGYRVKRLTSSLRELASLTMPCIAFIRGPVSPDVTAVETAVG